MSPARTDRPLLVLSDDHASSAAHLATACDRSPADARQQLPHLVERELVVVAAKGSLYHRAPMGVGANHRGRCRHILLIEDYPATVDVMTAVFESEGHAIVVSQTLADAIRLLGQVRFDLVLTDGFSRTPAAVVAATAGVVQAAGMTPVVLFTAHQLEREAVLAAGFRDLISKPFDLETLLQQVRTLLYTDAPLHAGPSTC